MYGDEHVHEDAHECESGCAHGMNKISMHMFMGMGMSMKMRMRMKMFVLVNLFHICCLLKERNLHHGKVFGNG